MPDGRTGSDRQDRTGAGGVAFDAAFEPLAVLAYRVAQRVLAGHGDAENVAAETLARAQLQWGRICDHAEPWVVTVATRLAVREAQRGQRAADRAGAAGGPQADGVDAVAARLDLARALRRLSRRQRQAVALRYLADLAEADAAAAMGCSVPSFRTHCHRALVSLRSQLQDPPRWAVNRREEPFA